MKSLYLLIFLNTFFNFYSVQDRNGNRKSGNFYNQKRLEIAEKKGELFINQQKNGQKFKVKLGKNKKTKKKK